MGTLARFRARPTRADEAYRPLVTLLIAACNEERTIRRKLLNSLQLDYPRPLLDIVVVADGSNDGTAAIVTEYADRGVRLLHQPERRGKSAALDRALRECRGEIVVFSDANTDYSAGAVAALVRHFADPVVGGVSGRKIVAQDAERAATDGETAYWSYEAALKSWESATGSITTADGEIFAIRRQLVEGIPRQVVHDDMYLTLFLVQRGFRVVYEQAATSSELASKSLRDEFHLKLRYASAGYQILDLYRPMFLPIPSTFGWRFLSHKLLRWIAPFLLIAVLFASAILAATSTVYFILFAAQVVFYVLAGLGLVLQPWTRATLFYFPLYFSVMNAAALCGFVKYFAVGQSPVWRKAER
jgi:cellulose synthase/poly-beta-1,6-N-acetylglucosamine synthase-like glycosyltransferase